jgi:hypothetical protein
MDEPLFDLRMADGSRHFAGIPQTISWYQLRDHLAATPDAVVTAFVTDHVTEAWIDVSYQGYHFQINDQYGEFWLFVTEVDCPDSVLRSFVAACWVALPPPQGA